MKVEVIFWDVQHGHASYIKTPNNRHIAIDLGVGSYRGGDSEFSLLLHLKHSYGIQRLDFAVITHPHKDHIDDIFNFEALHPKVFRRPKHLSEEDVLPGVRNHDIPKFRKYFEINNRYNQPLGDNNPNDPSNPNNYGGLIIKGFSPSRCSTSNINNHSIIMAISYADIKIIFPGDNESCSFEELLEDSSFRSAVDNADLLLAPHHGRASGYNSEFANLVNPRITVVSDGRFCDASATSRYSEISRGWTVHRRSGNELTRYCLSTRRNGVVSVQFGYDTNNVRFLSVTID